MPLFAGQNANECKPNLMNYAPPSNTFGISFFVKKYKAKNDLAPVYARITVKGKYLDVSLKRKVELSNWDERSGTTKGRKSEAHQLNQYLEQVRNRFYECREELEKERKLVTPEAVKNRYLGNDQQGQTLMELIHYHNTEMKSVLTWGTLKNYFTTQKYIEKFLKEKLKTSDVHLAELNYKFITRFESFVKGNRLIKNQKPCDQNGTMKHMERLRKMVSLAVKLEWLDKDPFHQYQLKFQKSRRGYLTAEELQNHRANSIFGTAPYAHPGYFRIRLLHRSILHRGVQPDVGSNCDGHGTVTVGLPGSGKSPENSSTCPSYRRL